MLLSVKQVQDPNGAPYFRVTLYSGARTYASDIVEEVPPRPKGSFSRIDYWLDVHVSDGQAMADVISTLVAERDSFAAALADAPSVIGEDGKYYADSFTVTLDMQAYVAQPDQYYLGVFDRCSQHLKTVQMVHLP